MSAATVLHAPLSESMLAMLDAWGLGHYSMEQKEVFVACMREDILKEVEKLHGADPIAIAQTGDASSGAGK